MSAEISICPLCHTPRMPRKKGDAWFLELPKLYSVYSNHHDDSSGAIESRRQGRNHGNQKFHTAVIGVRRGGATFQPEDGGAHELDLMQGEVNRAKR